MSQFIVKHIRYGIQLNLFHDDLILNWTKKEIRVRERITKLHWFFQHNLVRVSILQYIQLYIYFCWFKIFSRFPKHPSLWAAVSKISEHNSNLLNSLYSYLFMSKNLDQVVCLLFAHSTFSLGERIIHTDRRKCC